MTLEDSGRRLGQRWRTSPEPSDYRRHRCAAVNFPTPLIRPAPETQAFPLPDGVAAFLILHPTTRPSRQLPLAISDRPAPKKSNVHSQTAR